MNARVIPGQLVEAPVPDMTGMDRRAFGEFIGPQGELASYAIGWTTGADPHAARVTVGIGAGNPGGATFHAVVFAHEDSYAYALVDDPFENVPEGGPDLTADQARAHDDLPFIWWVIDRVVEQDPRARWMRHWLTRTRCIQTPEVFDLREPVLLVANDHDGIWQLIGATSADTEGHIGHLHHAIDEDPTLAEVLDLPPGWHATRTAPGQPWHREKVTEEPESQAL
ncbi:hypothetical protein [Nocardia sp. AG03]|uniref:hypothetical protein n=1 Tax=Nocardia sp. AG03 TaxID=3025312 RepID=UPI00241821B1|nr:hypothetical protein [Nocardia sp. AG03]